MNYATRVVIEDFKPQSQVTSDYNKGKAYQVQQEINKHKVDIDQSVFKKTRAEKIKLKEAKLNYSVDPEKGKDDVIMAFIGSKIPNWGGISLIVN